MEEKKTGFWSVGRLVIGIISMVFFIIIVFQSCAAGLSNAIQDSSETSGSLGFFIACFMLAGGIVGVATRNGKSIGGLIASTAVFFIAGLLGIIGWGSSYGDLKVWCIVSFLLALFYGFCAVMTKVKEKEKQ